MIAEKETMERYLKEVVKGLLYLREAHERLDAAVAADEAPRENIQAWLKLVKDTLDDMTLSLAALTGKLEGLFEDDEREEKQHDE